MKKAKKIIAILLAVCSLFAAGCGGSATEGDRSVFRLQIFTGGYGDEMWKYVLNEFEKDHPEYNVVAEMSNTINATSEMDWKDGNEPDFVFLDGKYDREGWLKNDLLYDFTEWLETAKVNGEDVLIKNKTDMNYAFRHAKKGGGEIVYGMPLLLTSYGMWYSDSLFKKNGWSVPENYDELVRWTNENASKEMKAVTYLGGDASGYTVQGFILPALAEIGESFYRRVENASDAEVFLSDEFKSVIKRFEEFVKLENGITKNVQNDWEAIQSEWVKSNVAAFMPNGLWLRKELYEKLGKDAYLVDEFDMRYTSSPLVKSERVLITSSVTCGVAKKAKNRQAALEFVTYLYRDDVAKKFMQCSESPTAVKVDTTGANISDTLKYALKVLNDDGYTKYSHVGSWGDGVNDAFNTGVKSIVAGTKTAEQLCSDLYSAAQKQLTGK